MKRFLFLAPLALALSVSAANVKISDLALVSTPSTNTFQEIADLNASGTNKSARVFLAWTSVGGSLQPLLPATNYFLGVDIFASGTNNGQNITLLGNRAAYQAIFDSATHDVFGAGFYPFRASVLQGASDVSAIGQNSLATSYLTNSADIHGWGNYALFGLAATNSSNIYGKGHSAGQGAVATGSGNLFFDGNESGLSSYFTNSFDISAFNGAFKGAGFTNSQNIAGILINAGTNTMFDGSYNLLLIGTNATVEAGAHDRVVLGPGMNLTIDGTNAAVVPTQVSLTHAGTVTLAFSPVNTEGELSLTGAVTFATSSLSAQHNYILYGRNPQATNCTPTFPAWQFQGSPPAVITAGKTFTLSLASRGTVDTNVWAAYSESP